MFPPCFWWSALCLGLGYIYTQGTQSHIGRHCPGCVTASLWAQLSRLHPRTQPDALGCLDAQGSPAQGRCDQPTEKASYPLVPGGSPLIPPGPVSSDPTATRREGVGGGGQAWWFPETNGASSRRKDPKFLPCGHTGELKAPAPAPPLAQPLLLYLG